MNAARARRRPSTRVDVADLLDELQYYRPHYPSKSLPAAIRRDLECHAVAAIGRQVGMNIRYAQAGDLILIGWAHRGSNWVAFTSQAESFRRFWEVRRESASQLAACAETLEMLVGHMDRHAAEIPLLLALMHGMSPDNVPAEDVAGIADTVAEEWRAVLAVTRDAHTIALRRAA